MNHKQWLWSVVPKPESKRQFFVAATLLVLLPLLVALQYRWLGHVSDGEREFLKANLRNAAERFSQDFDQELTRLFAAFQDGPFNPDLATQAREARYAAKFAEWQRQTAHPQLVSTVLLSQMPTTAPLPDFERLQWQCLSPNTAQFSRCDWPVELQALRTEFETRLGNLRRALEGKEPLIPRRFPEGLLDDVPALVFPLRQTQPPEFRLFNRGVRSPAPPDRLRLPPFFDGLMIVALNQTYLREQMLPALIKRHFPQAAADYDIVIRSRTSAQRVIFSAGLATDAKGQVKLQKFTQPDVAMGLFGIRQELFRELMREQWRQRTVVSTEPAENGNRPVTFALSLPGAEESGRWQLLMQHRAGSLAAVVATARRRNLLLSFSILLLLAASIALLLSSARRAERLAQLQMDFVAGVSHELRTPISVIDAAGYNLTKGHIKNAEQMARYGNLIRQESRRLTDMVEQILEFAGAQSKRQQYDLQPTDLNQLIEETLATPLLTEEQFAVEADLPAESPCVQADAVALRRALQNLINNAVKYSGDSRWLKLQAKTDSSNHTVQITIQDRGLGIPASDLPHIFEPFYRGSEARAAQIHGNGLGLSLVKNIIEAHGGQITVTSEAGRGSVFTVRLPWEAELDAV
jgi:signal transduction histidine kinase